MPISADNKFKIIVAGDVGTGKSCMVDCYYRDTFPVAPFSDVEEVYNKKVQYNEQEYELEIVDTIDNELISDHVKNEMYQTCDCLILTYSITDIQSFKDIPVRYSKLPITLENHQKWTVINDQIKKFPPIILLGTKEDLAMSRQVSSDSALQIVDKLALDGFLECSSLKNYNINKVFERAIELSCQYRDADNDYKYIDEQQQQQPLQEEKAIEYIDQRTVPNSLNNVSSSHLTAFVSAQGNQRQPQQQFRVDGLKSVNNDNLEKRKKKPNTANERNHGCCTLM